jgi:hypothetical protein
LTDSTKLVLLKLYDASSCCGKHIDNRQGIIVFVESKQDVAACLKFVQHQDLDLTIAYGRRNYWSASSIKDGLVIGSFKSVLEVRLTVQIFQK